VQSDNATTEEVVAKKSSFQLTSQSGASRKNAFVTPKFDVETTRPANMPTKKTFQSIVSKKGLSSTSTKKTNGKNNQVSQSKKLKKKDYPNAPKRPMNAYMYYTEVARKG
jgi:hypothetical protein